jgi:predicted homoserine dehydrogenase-like protein
LSKKHLVTFNVEGDVVIGHILKMLADNAGVVYTGVHGDEPGVVKALYDEADALGFEILAAGRHDYGGGDIKWNKNNANEYLKRFKAASVQGNLSLFASFIDGSKTNEECAMIANATGLSPDVRGMHGPEVSFIEFPTRVPQLLDSKKNGGILQQTGVVERILPAEGPDAQPVWCFVVVRVVNELQRVYMSDMAGMGNLAGSLNPGTGGMTKTQLLDDGSGRLDRAGIFYTPYHYVSIQAPISIAHAVIYNRPTIAPIGPKRFADVMALTKKDLRTGDIIDEIGGECIAGRIEKARVVREGGYIPFALACGGKVLRDINQGEYLRWEDLALRDDRALIVELRRLQDTLFDVA